MGKIPSTSIIAARIVKPDYQNAFTRGSNNVEILHVVRRQNSRTRRTIVLTPWFYREGIDQIVANLRACGIEIRTPLSTKDRPIWDREPME